MTDAFLIIHGIKGESTDARHKDWCEVVSFEWGVSQAASTRSTAGDAAAERADFEDFVVCKVVDRASAPLYLACADGRRIAKVVLEACRAGGQGQKLFFRLTLKDAVVASMRLTSQAAASGGGDAVEQVAFRYSEIGWEYFEMGHEGLMAKSPFRYGWNLKSNKST